MNCRSLPAASRSWFHVDQTTFLSLMTSLTRAVPARRLLAGAALLTSWLLPAATAAPASHLNLVLILADDLGQRDVGYE